MSSEKPPLVVHWDGKMMQDNTNLEDPKSKGLAQAKATFQLLTIWEVDDIVGM